MEYSIREACEYFKKEIIFLLHLSYHINHYNYGHNNLDAVIIYLCSFIIFNGILSSLEYILKHIIELELLYHFLPLIYLLLQLNELSTAINKILKSMYRYKIKITFSYDNSN